MRSRITVVLFASLLMLGVVGCSKKEEPPDSSRGDRTRSPAGPGSQPAAGQPGGDPADNSAAATGARPLELRALP